MKHLHWLLGMLICLGLFSGCQTPVAEETPSQPTETPTQTATITATIDWFPATATATPRPTQPVEPTQEMRPGIGAVLVDNLLAETAAWRTGNFTAGNITLVNNTLTLAIQQPKAALLSLEQKNILRNFNLETRVNVNMCRMNDVYGILVHAASEYNYYRLLVNCQGNVRAERVRDGTTTLMQDWTPSGLPPGAPLDVELGVWMVGSEIRFFANDALVFSVKDPVFKEGTVGVFARADSDSPVTVTFSEMKVSEVNIVP